MSRNSRNLIITLGVLVLLGGGYFAASAWKNRPHETPPYTPAPKIGNLTGYMLVKIEVPDLVLEKNEDAWELVSVKGGKAPEGITINQNQIRDMTYALATIYVEQIVEEAPEDISIYGLDTPFSRTVITDSEGGTAVYIVGDLASSRTSRYVMQEGDPKVYTISSYSSENMSLTLDKIRERSLFPSFEIHEVETFLLESPSGAGSDAVKIEISARPESVPPYLSASYASHLMTSPYNLTRAVNFEAFNRTLAPLRGLRIDEFIDDHPSSLAPYGLERPIKISLRISADSLDLLIGSQINGNRYAKLSGSNGIFTLAGLEDLIGVKPFFLIDKYAALINIDTVSRLSITGGENAFTAEIQPDGSQGDGTPGNAEDPSFFLNGNKAEARSFRNWYQSVIEILLEAEYPKGSKAMEGETEAITIEYQLSTPPGARETITLIPFNRDFYTLRQRGTMEFLSSRNQVRTIFEAAGAVIFEN